MLLTNNNLFKRPLALSYKWGELLNKAHGLADYFVLDILSINSAVIFK